MLADCASQSYYWGAWWYGCCHYSNLNGKWGDTRYAKGPVWYQGWGYYDPLEGTQMMLRSTKSPPVPILTCKDCPAGQYQASSAFTGSSCIPCAAGYFSNTVKTSACTACAKGQVQPAKGQKSCTNCAVGKYTGGVGQITCQECTAGKYQASTGGTSCNLWRRHVPGAKPAVDASLTKAVPKLKRKKLVQEL